MLLGCRGIVKPNNCPSHGHGSVGFHCVQPNLQAACRSVLRILTITKLRQVGNWKGSLSGSSIAFVIHSLDPSYLKGLGVKETEFLRGNFVSSWWFVTSKSSDERKVWNADLRSIQSESEPRISRFMLGVGSHGDFYRAGFSIAVAIRSYPIA